MKPKPIKRGERIAVEMPYTEVCMHLKVAGKTMGVEVVGRPYPMAQLFEVTGEPFSFPVNLGEVGVYLIHEEQEALIETYNAALLSGDPEAVRRAADAAIEEMTRRHIKEVEDS